ncbi:hypothetical protein MD484_g2308, partial [Candolleomyces efflorescens]
MSTKRAEYLPNSRQPDVDKLCERESSSTDLVLCIHGPAGIGKSTLAGHLTDEFRHSGRLAASIFLGVIPEEMSEPETIVKMIGYEIGCIHPGAIPKIVEAMDQCHGAPLDTYLHGYVVEPLRSLGHPRPLIVIMDALDEWQNHQTFLRALAALNSTNSVVKFFLTGRLNPCAYRSPGIDKVSIYTYALGPISKEVIKAYFDKHLATVPWVDGRKAHPEDVEKLTELSCGLPVWASTVIALLSHPYSESPPHKVLEEIVGTRQEVGGSEGMSELYHKGLLRLFSAAKDQEYFRRYMGAISALQEPVTQANFSALTGIPSHLIPRIQFSLSALQIRSPPPGSETMVHPASTLHHLSFLEYLRARTIDPAFAISTFESHYTISLACIKQLRSLPCSSNYGAVRLSALQSYSVKYFPLHISNGTPRSSDQQSPALQTMVDVRRQWAALFLRKFVPEEVAGKLEDKTEDDSMVTTLRNLADWLSVSGGDHWGSQVACLEVAVRIDGRDADAWSDLGRCYGTRGAQTGNLRMHEESVAAFQQALHLRPDPHPSRGDLFHYVANALWSCYQQNGDLNLLDESISCFRMALTLSPVPNPNRARYLGNIAGALTNLYNRNGDSEILTEAVSLLREALELCPAAHEDYPWQLDSLARALTTLDRHNHDIQALDEAILLHRKALTFRPPSHPDRATSLNNLAAALANLYGHNKNIDTLTELTSLFREALGLRPAPHPHRSSSLNNLADSLLSVYQHDKACGTLNECISLGREALALWPTFHPHRHLTVNILARAYLSQCEQAGSGAVEALDEAISLVREGPVLCPPGHRSRAAHVIGLLKLLKKRRDAAGDDRDSEEIEDWEAELAR